MDLQLPPSLAIRSSSTSDVFADYTGAEYDPHPKVAVPLKYPNKPHKGHGNAPVPIEGSVPDINLNPEDYVVSNGQAYRVTRSPRGLTVPSSGKCIKRSSSGLTSGDGTAPNASEQGKVRMLLKALDEANRKITEQNNLISRQQQRIHELEKALGREPSSGGCHIGIGDPLVKSGCAMLADENSSLTPRGRNRIHTAIRTEKELQTRAAAAGTPPIVQPASSHPSPCGSSCPEGDREPLTSPPSPVRFISKQRSGSYSSSSIGSSAYDSSPDLSNLRKTRGEIACTESPVGPRGALAARLSMSTKERRMQGGRVRGPKTGGSVSSKRGVPVGVQGGSVCDGVTSSSPPPVYLYTGSSKPCLFIAHDNPQLGKSVATLLQTSSESSIMIESKGSNDMTCVILGTITFSGETEGVIREGTVDAVVPADQHRGSYCIACENMSAFRFRLSEVEKRMKGVITEINLSARAGSGSVTECADISSSDLLAAFLEPCASRVDVILAPCHSDSWYPYWELDSSTPPAETVMPPPGSRRLAPQFRSNGIGYLRLGDDMSRYGTSFLSCDGFQTYLDNGNSKNITGECQKNATGRSVPGVPLGELLNGAVGSSVGRKNVEAGLAVLGVGSPKSPRRRRLSGGSSVDLSTDGVSGENCKQNSVLSVNSDQSMPLPDASDRKIQSKEELLEHVQMISQVENTEGTELKWSDRVGILHKCYEYIEKCLPLELDAVAEVAFSIQEQLQRQHNPLVLKESLGCICSLARHIQILLSAEDFQTWLKEKADSKAAVACKALITSAANALRHSNRGVSDSARSALNSLFISGQGGDTYRSRVLFMISSVSSEIMTGPRGGSSAGVARVVQWLVGILEDHAGYVLSRENIAEEGLAALDVNSVSAICEGTPSLLQHREKSVREAAVTLTAQLFALDVRLHCGVGGLDSSCIPRDKESLADSLSSSGRSILMTAILDTVISQHVQSRVVQRSIEYIAHMCSRASGDKLSKTSGCCDSNIKPDQNTALSSLTEKRLSGKLRSLKRKTSQVKPPARDSDRSTRSSQNGTYDVDIPRLSSMLFEAKLILRSPVLNTKQAWEQFSETVSNAPVFFRVLDATAQLLYMPPGSLLRRLLPFDENTSSTDQSDVSSQDALQDILSGEGGSVVDPQVLSSLQNSAKNIRGTIRVKMADEADLKQAETAVEQLNAFRVAVLDACSKSSTSERCVHPCELIDSITV